MSHLDVTVANAVILTWKSTLMQKKKKKNFIEGESSKSFEFLTEAIVRVKVFLRRADL